MVSMIRLTVQNQSKKRPDWIIRGIYEAFLSEFLSHGDIFMHDRAFVHRAYIARDLLSEMDVNIMEWPPYFPDLN